MRYVKVCPRCGYKNDELAEACEKDGEFLGMTPATADTAPPAQPAANPAVTPPIRECPAPSAPAPAAPAPAAPAVPARPAPATVTQRFAEPTALLYLDMPATGQCHEIRDGWTVGQAHPTSPAQVQLSNIPGANYIHRNHCRFDFREGRWQVTALPQPEYTNPTFVNQQRLTAGQTTLLRNGDRLTLANVVLNVRIIEI